MTESAARELAEEILPSIKGEVDYHSSLYKSVVEVCQKKLMKAILSSRLVEMKWFPIEEAPKDGTMILVCLPNQMELIIRARFNTIHKYWITDYEGEGGVSRAIYFHKGDLWMPMPPKPSSIS